MGGPPVLPPLESLWDYHSRRVPKYSVTRFEMCLKSKAQAGVGGRGDQTGHVGGHGSALRIVSMILTISRWGSEFLQRTGLPVSPPSL